MRPLLVMIVFILLTGCGKQLPPMLPSAPELTQELRTRVWPIGKQSFRLEGTLSVYSKNISLRGFVLADYPSEAVTVALLTQMGTSVLEASVTREDYTLVTVSPLLKKYPSITERLIKMVRSIYLPPTPITCTAEALKNTAYLRCEEEGILHAFNINQTNLKPELTHRVDAEAGTDIRLAAWSDTPANRYPKKITYYDNACGLTATFIQSMLDIPMQRLTEN